jgi:NOL1/NOP2/sun family putative RNA methylase
MFPAAFVQRIIQQFPKHHQELLEAFSQEVPISIRYNPAKVAGVKAPHCPVPWHEQGVYLHERPAFTFDPLFHAGAYYVQEASSMLLKQAFQAVLNGLRKDPVVLDLCAAPGGKTTLLASAMQNSGLLVANEVIKNRAQILRENVIKWGAHNVVVTQNDARHFAALPHHFDVAVVDAPCSGEGLFRKDPQAREEWSEDNAALCAQRQQRILADVWPALKPGGFLIYSTCTFNPAENEENLAWLQANGMGQTFQWQLPEDWPFEKIALEQMEGYAAYPHKVKGEGFFIAIIQKTADLPGNNDGKQRRSKDLPKKTDKKLAAQMPYAAAIAKESYSIGEYIVWLPVAMELWAPVFQHMHAIHAGVPLGQFKGKQWIPAHASALAGMVPDDIASVALNEEQALAYLRGQAIRLNDALKGWLVVTYRGLALGYCKNLGNRCNNYYPRSWVIRSQKAVESSEIVLRY